MFYTSIASPTVSDHKPVASLFRVQYKRVDPVQEKRVA
jgi:RhoGAP domain